MSRYAHPDRRPPMEEYQQALEKAVLEYAATIGRNPKHSADKPTKIPGFPDTLVWSTARQLAEQGLISTSTIDEDGKVIISDLREEGTTRLEAILAELAQKEEQQRQDREARVKTAKKKKAWWQVWK